MSGGPRWLIDGYEEWLQREGIAVITGLSIDLLTVETVDWPRLGTRGAVVHLDARGDYCDLHLVDIPAGGSSAPQRHIYEEVVYVLDGQGSTVLEHADGRRHSFEWGRGSLFAVPINMRYRHLNASGQKAARLAHVTNLPMVMKLFRDDQFVFNSPHEFNRAIADDFYTGNGTFHEVRQHRHQWETTFVPDLLTFDQLRESQVRGKDSTNIQFVLGDATMHAHMSEIPPGNYKKAHRHEEGYHIFQLSGEGYSLYWYEGEEPRRVDWTYGLVHAPSRAMWHQHFNVGEEPARYAAATLGSIRYPYTKDKMTIWARTDRSNDQIEYEQEDSSIRQTFDRERASYAAVLNDRSDKK